MSTKEQNSAIEGLALAKSSPILNWKFEKSGKVIVDGQNFNIYIGEIAYPNPKYEMGGAVQLKDWVFALERMTEEARKRYIPKNDPEMWVISGFHQNTHYSFLPIKAESQKERNQLLLEYIMTRIFPILFSEHFTQYLNESQKCEKGISIQWQLFPLNETSTN